MLKFKYAGNIIPAAILVNFIHVNKQINRFHSVLTKTEGRRLFYKNEGGRRGKSITLASGFVEKLSAQKNDETSQTLYDQHTVIK